MIQNGKHMKKLFISVIGESKASRKNYEAAEKVGELLAKHGAIIFCGGTTGVMEGVCKGAKKGGGITVGILPSSKRSHANKYVDIPIPTGVGYARNKYVVKSGQAVIAIGGSYGTLCEIGFALGYKIPVIGINTWQFQKKGHKKSSIIYVKSPENAVKLAIEAAKKRK
ncbi:MAG: TIGR00725 family protein [Candidatus Margulisiibacteriota bacterium]